MCSPNFAAFRLKAIIYQESFVKAVLENRRDVLTELAPRMAERNEPPAKVFGRSPWKKLAKPTSVAGVPWQERERLFEAPEPDSVAEKTDRWIIN